jgi:hypothetical protein
MTWNFDLTSAPRNGSHILMETTDGKRYLTKWLAPTKFTPNGRFDGFSENAKTMLAWCAVPEHPNHIQERPSINDEASPEAGPQAEASLAGIGAGTLAGREGRREGEAASAGLPTNLIVHKHIFLDDAGSGA